MQIYAFKNEKKIVYFGICYIWGFKTSNIIFINSYFKN